MKNMNTSDGGAGGMPGVKKNKTMNAYKNGGMVSAMPKGSDSMKKGIVRGGGAATKGLSFED